MPITKHHQKKYPHSEWVRRRNIRRASKQDTSNTVEATAVSKETSEDVRLKPAEAKPKGFIKKNMDAIRSAFAGLGRRSKNAA